MKFKHLRTKLIATYISVFMIVIITFAGMLYPLMKRTIEKSVDETLTMQIELIKTGIESSFNAAITSYFRASANLGVELADDYYKKALALGTPMEEARAEFFHEIQSLKIGEAGYFAVMDTQNVVLAHPFDNIVGSNSEGVEFVKNFRKDKEVYFSYLWQNTTDASERKKVMYAIYYAPWEFYVLATGYEDDFKYLVNIEDFEDQILSIKFGETGYPIVFDLEGTYVVHPSFKGVNMMDRDDAMGDITRKAIALRNGKSDYLWKNIGEDTYRKKVTVFSEIEGFDMIVATTAYESEFMQPLNDLTKILLTMLVVSLLVVFLLSFKVSDNITRPIIETKELMDAAELGDLSVRSQIASTDEVGSIAVHFNHFMESLERTQDQLIEEERFSNVGRIVTRVSHHLNTPVGNAMMAHSFMEKSITDIRENTENRRSISALMRSVTEVEESSDSIKRSLEAVSKIINSFNRLNTGLYSGHKQDINLKEFLELRYLGRWEKGLPSHVAIKIDCADQIHLETYPNMLEVVLDHLTENAVSHGLREKEDGIIQITAGQAGSRVRIVFEDNGKGIPEERAEHVFEPFFDPGDNLNNLGLGLNIVYNAVRISMEGSIKYETLQPSGARFTILL